MSQPISIFRTPGPGAATLGETYEGVAVSSTNTYYSTPLSCSFGDGFSLTLKWTGTPTGTFTVWKTDIAQPNLANDADWEQDTDFGTAGSVAAAGSADIYASSAANAKNRWWRVKYVNASGTGTITGSATTHRSY